MKSFEDAAPQKCVKCDCKFNSLTNRRFQCYFCGFFVCKEHSKKRREDPSKSISTTGLTNQSSNVSSMVTSTSSVNTNNTTPATNPNNNNNNNTSSLNISDNTNNEYEKKNFKRICDVCEDKYLKWQINFAF